MKKLMSAITLLAMTSAAWAGDFSEFRPLGFSADGGVFAFEEFGIQDGSGFPYVNRFFIDTATDTYLEGTPVRVRLENEQASLGAARAEAAAKSSDLMLKYAFDANPGTLAAFNPQSAVADAHRLSWRPLAVVPDPFSPSTAVLTEKDLPASEFCKAYTPESKGFRLDVTALNGKPVTITLNDDTRIPDSRGCTTGYRLGGIMTHYADGSFIHAFLVQVRTYGFEGEDGRWIAITRKLGSDNP